MKLAMIGLLALVVGVVGGALFSGSRMKDAILEEREQAVTDSLAALTRATNPSPDGAESRSPGEATPSEGGAMGGGRRDVTNSVAEGSSASESGSVVTTTTFELPSAAPSASTRGADDDGPSSADAVGEAVDAEMRGVEPETSDPMRSPAPDGPNDGSRETMAASAAADSAAIQGAMQLARMFSSMKPVDAAAVLQELTDPEVDAILRHMQARLAGQILGEFEPARAALLSRTVLGGVPTP